MRCCAVILGVVKKFISERFAAGVDGVQQDEFSKTDHIIDINAHEHGNQQNLFVAEEWTRIAFVVH